MKEGDQISLTISDGTILAMAKQIRTMDEKGSKKEEVYYGKEEI